VGVVQSSVVCSVQAVYYGIHTTHTYRSTGTLSSPPEERATFARTTTYADCGSPPKWTGVRSIGCKMNCERLQSTRTCTRAESHISLPKRKTVKHTIGSMSLSCLTPYFLSCPCFAANSRLMRLCRFLETLCPSPSCTTARVSPSPAPWRCWAC
jgi:hypothetical protein